LSGWKDWQIGEVVEAAEFQTFIQDQVVQVYADSSARGSALGTAVAEGMASYVKDTDSFEVYDGSGWVEVAPGYLTAGTAGQILRSNGTADPSYVAAETTLTAGTAGHFVQSAGTAGIQYTDGYLFRETVYFTSSGTFSKGDYPWLRAIRVKCQAGGAAGGGANAASTSQVSVGGGGGGGAYAESFITNIAGLDSSVTVTRGAGGAGVSAGTGGGGGTSSFGSLVSASGGNGGLASAVFTDGGLGPVNPVESGGTGDLVVSGSSGQSGLGIGTTGGRVRGGVGGGSFLGGGAHVTSRQAGHPGAPYGGGGSGARALPNEGDEAGGDGADGIVIIELYA
jgi:hypothetical protein